MIELKTVGVPNVVECLFPNIPNFIAHIISTIIIVLLLTKLLYKPAKKIIAERRKRVESILEDVLNKQIEYKQHELEAKIVLDNAIEQAKKIVEESKQNARIEGKLILDKAKKEIEIDKKVLLDNLEASKIEAKKEVKDMAVELAFDIANKILNKKLSEKDQEEMINNFLKEI